MSSAFQIARLSRSISVRAAAAPDARSQQRRARATATAHHVIGANAAHRAPQKAALPIVGMLQRGARATPVARSRCITAVLLVHHGTPGVVRQ